jgi:hypothetical protein
MSKNLRCRIRTNHEGLSPKQRARGQDLVVDMVDHDGTVVGHPCVAAVYVDGRTDYVTAVLVVHDVELDLEASSLTNAVESLREGNLRRTLKLELEDNEVLREALFGDTLHARNVARAKLGLEREPDPG